MMFLNFLFGEYGLLPWTVTWASIGATGAEMGEAYWTQSLGAIIAPFIIGLIADRYLAAQKMLGILHHCRCGINVLYL